MPIKKVKPVAEKIAEEQEIFFENENVEKVPTIKIKDVSTQKEKEISVRKLEEIQNKNEKIIFRDIEGKMLLVRVGTQNENATDDQIKDVETKLNELMERLGIKCLVFVTHHAVDIQIIR